MLRLPSRSEGWLALVVLVYLTIAFGYALVTPTWQNPDEPAHYNYIVHVARTASLPELRPGDWNSDLNFRVKTAEIPPEHPGIVGMRYESWQPPLYYLVAGGVYRVLGGDDLRRDVLLLRGLGVLLGGMTLVVGYAAARAACWPGGLGVSLTLAGVPMFTAISGSISADPLANLICGGLFLLLLRALRSTLDLPRAAGLGFLLGLGLLTKLGVAVYLPLVLVAALVRGRPRWQAVLVALAVAGLLLLPWLVHGVATYGWADPLATRRHDLVVADQPRFPGLSWAYAVEWLSVTYHSFWAQFGWMAILVPDRLYWVWGLLACMGVLGLALSIARAGLVDRPLLLSGLAIAGAAAAYVGYNLSFQQAQGRYLFPALVPLCLLLVRGWAAFFPPRWRSVGSVVVPLGLVGINGYTLTRVLAPAFNFAW